jgi:hypothetical protein
MIPCQVIFVLTFDATVFDIPSFRILFAFARTNAGLNDPLIPVLCLNAKPR